jgi:hypothetical protein
MAQATPITGTPGVNLAFPGQSKPVLTIAAAAHLNDFLPGQTFYLLWTL